MGITNYCTWKFLEIDYLVALLLTVLSDDVMKMLSWFSNCGDGVTIPVGLTTSLGRLLSECVGVWGVKSGYLVSCLSCIFSRRFS